MVNAHCADATSASTGAARDVSVLARLASETPGAEALVSFSIVTTLSNERGGLP